MIFKNEKQILKIIRYSPIIFVLLFSTFVVILQFYERNNIFNKEKNRIQNEFLNQKKANIKQKIDEVYSYIEKEKKKTELELKNSLNEAITNAHEIAQSIYNNNKTMNKEQIKKLIIDALRNVRFNNGRGYYFIYDKSGKNLLLPYSEEFEGKNFYNHQDSKGKYIVREMIEALKSKDLYFCEWYWFSPNHKEEQKRKIGLVKNFEPFDWFIGTGEYIDDYEKEIQKKILEHVNEISYDKNGYIFIFSYDGVYLSHIRKNYIGKNVISQKDATNIKNVIENLINLAKSGEGFYSYTQLKKPGSDLTINKTSFVKGIADWKWVIGTGFYEDDMNEVINTRKKELDIHFRNNIQKTIYISIIIIIILLILSIYFSKLLENKFAQYKKEIKFHILKNSKQQAIMSQQAKMAAMGEMIGNIAHQWRQPLSAISTTATGLKLQKEMNILDENFLLDGLENINKQSQYLSSTIDDFRNFFTINKEKNQFSIKDSIDKAIALVSAKFKNKNIVILENLEDTKIKNFENEFIQVIINILNNACDALIENKYIKEKIIFLSTKVEKNSVKIEIKDNAGGIKDNIIDRIFEPYFTTKHQKQGTGIGLYMSREIIMKNMEGNIKVTNDNFIYNYTNYKGAKFQITLPL